MWFSCGLAPVLHPWAEKWLDEDEGVSVVAGRAACSPCWAGRQLSWRTNKCQLRHITYCRESIPVCNDAPPVGSVGCCSGRRQILQVRVAIVLYRVPERSSCCCGTQARRILTLDSGRLRKTSQYKINLKSSSKLLKPFLNVWIQVSFFYRCNF